MPRGVENAERDVPQGNGIAIPHQNIGGWRVGDAQPEHRALPARRPHLFRVVRMDVHARACPLLEGRDRPHVIEVPVGEKDLVEDPPPPGQLAQDLVGLVPGVDHDRLPARRVPHDVGVLRQRADLHRQHPERPGVGHSFFPHDANSSVYSEASRSAAWPSPDSTTRWKYASSWLG